MSWSSLNLKVTIVVFILGLAVLFGGQVVYQRYALNQPLEDRLAENPVVAEYVLEDQGPALVIKVCLKNTADLQLTYQELCGQVEETMHGRPYQLVIEDDRDEALSKAYYESQFAIYQAIAQGSFTEMADQVRAQAAAVGATAKVYVDSDYVYVQMENKKSFLAEVIPRQGYGGDLSGLKGGTDAYAQRG